MMTEPGAADLLADIRSLRARARGDRHGYAFPLFLFGTLILLAPLLYAPRNPERYYDSITEGWDPRFDGSNPLIRIFRTTAGTDPMYPNLVAWYWLLTIVGGFLASAWWYRRRADRIGVETDTRGFLVAAGATFAGFFLGTYALQGVARSLYGARTVNVPILLGSAMAAAIAVYWCTRPARTSAQRTVGVFTAALFAAVTFSSIGVYTNRGFSALFVIAAGLLALAWLERSALLGVIGLLFTLAAIPATLLFSSPSLYVNINAWFWHLGWRIDPADRQLEVLQMLVLPAAILLIGGAIAALTSWHPRHNPTGGRDDD